MARTSSVRLERTRVLKAMAHPSRLLILETLSEGERCVCDLQRLVGSDLSTVSKHLALMREAGLVADHRQGLQVFYELRVPCLTRFFDCIDAVRTAPAAVASGRRGASRDVAARGLAVAAGAEASCTAPQSPAGRCRPLAKSTARARARR